MGVVVPFKAAQKYSNGVSGLFLRAKQHCAAASQGTQKSPHREEQKTAAEHDDQQHAGTAIAECQVDRRSSNSSRLKAEIEVQQAQQAQTRSGHLALNEGGVFVFCLETK